MTEIVAKCGGICGWIYGHMTQVLVPSNAKEKRMSQLKDWQKKELLQRARLVIEDADYAPEESYTGKAIDFSDSCGCYSEWTQECCYLEVHLTGTIEGNGWEQRSNAEHAIRKWADGALEWSGCGCCGEDTLSVHVRLFAKKPENK